MHLKESRWVKRDVPKQLSSQKKNQAIDAAVDVCPLIGFVQDVDSLPAEQHELVDIIPLTQAFSHGKNIFSRENVKDQLRTVLLIPLALYQRDSLSGDDIASFFLSKQKTAN